MGQLPIGDHTSNLSRNAPLILCIAFETHGGQGKLRVL
jgi:hypothetical protein